MPLTPAAPARLSFRMASAQDTQAIVSLLNRGFRTPIDERTWEWYVYRNPLGHSRIYLAEDSARTIAGVVGFAPIPLRFDGARIKADYAHHLVLEPAYRETLSYMGIMRFALHGQEGHGVQLIIGPPNRTAYPIHKALTKWVDFGFLDCLRKTGYVSRPHACTELRRFDESFDRFYGRVSKLLEFCLEKTAFWMNWRFFERPGSPYAVYAVFSGGELAGYVIVKRWQDPDGYRKAHIIDLHALDDAALAELIAAAEAYGADCNEVNLWAVQGYPYLAALETLGFTVVRRQPLIARTFDGQAPRFPSGPCSLSYGDGDTQY
jgi:hypothetical protein